MNNTYLLISILIMIFVTYLPRALPILFFNKKIESRFIKDFLFYVPYAVLSILIFPSVFYCTGNIYISLIGTLAALLSAFFTKKLLVVALISVLAIYLLEFIL